MRVSHRPGYFAPRPYAEQSGTERRLRTAELLLGGRNGGSIEARVRADVAESGGARSRVVDVSVQIDPRTVLPTSRRGELRLQIYSYALDAREVVHDFFTTQLRLDLAAVETMGDDGFWVWGKLVLRPGEYTLRTLVRNAQTGDTGVWTTRVTVPGG